MIHSQGYKIVKDLYDAYHEGDLVAFYKDLSAELTWIECEGFPAAGVFRNKEEIVDNVFSVLARDWSRWDYQLEQLIDAGEYIVAVGTYRGTHGTTVKSFSARAAHVWQVTDGKITRFEQFADTHLMQNAATA
ncbi:nuclear transport factor 2 family protein [Streptomyces sp. NPDC017991]|uniref:nuclear transport factor 2 family protein n=1 Tax=Streptomyces sp. NPDC017991 TaxID=3365026 RepID=UPI0037B3B919